MAAYLDGNFQFCGASIISDRWALTAAHCTGAQFPSNQRISVGSLRHDGAGNPGATYYWVEQAIDHPSFSGSNLDYDVALLYLSDPITFGPTVQPLPLAPTNAPTYAGVQTTCTGWGTTTEGGSVSPILREVTYPIISNAECSSYYNGVTARMVCAYEPGKDSCQGDSGGPFFVPSGSGYLDVGIVSWGQGCARVGAPGVYTRISSVRSWICQTSI